MKRFISVLIIYFALTGSLMARFDVLNIIADVNKLEALSEQERIEFVYELARHEYSEKIEVRSFIIKCFMEYFNKGCFVSGFELYPDNVNKNIYTQLGHLMYTDFISGNGTPALVMYTAYETAINDFVQTVNRADVTTKNLRIASQKLSTFTQEYDVKKYSKSFNFNIRDLYKSSYNDMSKKIIIKSYMARRNFNINRYILDGILEYLMSRELLDNPEIINDPKVQLGRFMYEQGIVYPRYLLEISQDNIIYFADRIKDYVNSSVNYSLTRAFINAPNFHGLNIPALLSIFEHDVNSAVKNKQEVELYIRNYVSVSIDAELSKEDLLERYISKIKQQLLSEEQTEVNLAISVLMNDFSYNYLDQFKLGANSEFIKPLLDNINKYNTENSPVRLFKICEGMTKFLNRGLH